MKSERPLSKRPLLFSDYTVPPATAARREAAVRAALAHRRPARGLGPAQQLRTQLGYIGGWFWLGLAALLAALVWMYAQLQSYAAMDPAAGMLAPTLMLFSITGPLLAALAAPILARSTANGMWELEEAAFHNLPRLTTLRMVLTLLAALPVLAVLAALGMGSTGVLPGLLALLIPLLLACAANYLILGRLRGTPGSLCCVGACLVLALVFFTLFSQTELLTPLLHQPGWLAAGLPALAAAVALFLFSARRYARRSPAEAR